MKYKLYINELTNQILGFSTYPINVDTDEHLTEDDSIIKIDFSSDKDYFFIDNEIVVKNKDNNIYDNKLSIMKQKAEELKNKNATSIMNELLNNDKPLDLVGQLYKEYKNQLKVLENEIQLLELEHKQKLKLYYKNKFQEMNNVLNTKYYSSVCLLIKNENEYLEEWLKWYLNLGIEHIYIYDNGSTTPIKNTVDEILSNNELEKVTVIEWLKYDEHLQIECYNHCLKNFGKETRWIGFFDSDEFIRLIKDSNINEFLQLYEDYGALTINWLIYNADGNIEKTSKPVRERFKKVVTFEDVPYIGKVFVQPHRTKKMLVHEAILLDGDITVNEKKEDAHKSNNNKINDYIVLDHYYTKSYEEWCEKILRGSSDPIYKKKYADFFRYNKDLLYLMDEGFQSEQGYE